jgi:hypothetical protein
MNELDDQDWGWDETPEDPEPDDQDLRWGLAVPNGWVNRPMR